MTQNKTNKTTDDLDLSTAPSLLSAASIVIEHDALEEQRAKLVKLGIPLCEPGSSGYETVKAIDDYIADKRHFVYTFDEDLPFNERLGITSKRYEVWRSFYEAVLNGEKVHGDCVEENERIYVNRNGSYTPVPIKDINVGDMVLSYDFEKREYVDKPVTNKVDKGLLETFRVNFSNHTHIHVTANHNMWSKERQHRTGYVKRQLNEITSRHHHYMPFARELPYVEIEDNMDKDLWFVVGHYLAEGWSEINGKVQSSGHDLHVSITPILDQHNIPYTSYVNNSGVPCINFLSSWFKDFLKPLKKNSFNINMSKYLNLSKDKLEAIINGYWVGDGHFHIKKNSTDIVWSTSSNDFANWLYQASLRIGRPVYVYCQENHGGCGTKPIYRVICNLKSSLQKEYGYDGLGQITMKDKVSIGKRQCWDITVQDTSTFVFENGTLGHNCDDFGLTALQLACIAGVPRSRLAQGIVVSETAWKYEGKRNEDENIDHFIGMYYYNKVWWTFGDTWAQDVYPHMAHANKRHRVRMMAILDEGLLWRRFKEQVFQTIFVRGIRFF